MISDGCMPDRPGHGSPLSSKMACARGAPPGTEPLHDEALTMVIISEERGPRSEDCSEQKNHTRTQSRTSSRKARVRHPSRVFHVAVVSAAPWPESSHTQFLAERPERGRAPLGRCNSTSASLYALGYAQSQHAPYAHQVRDLRNRRRCISQYVRRSEPSQYF